MTREGRQAEGGPRLSIGALSRATGIPVETLRTWESRYGYPVPERKASGHRVYPLAGVARLRRIAEALARGHRAGQVLLASDDDLAALLRATPPQEAQPEPEASPWPGAETLGVEHLLQLVERFESDRLTRVLLVDWARLSPLAFLESRAVPLLRSVGDAWRSGRLEIRHEHFVSERLGDLLRSLRLPFEERAHGPLVVMGSLPGEQHGLGLQMAALVIATAGCRILFLGTEVPGEQMAALARERGARALAVSVSLASQGAASASSVQELRRLLPRRVALLVGGDGAPKATPGVEVLRSLAATEAWGRRAAGEAATARS